MRPKQKIAVLGAGPAGMAAAYRLASGENRGKYDITVYQMGSRLGGKCSTTRGPGNRIQEHGIHMLFGFYDEAWALLREAYAAVEPLLPENYAIKKLTDAFLPQTDTFAMAMDEGSNEWVRWQVKVPLHAYDPRVEAAPEPFDRTNIWTTMVLAVHLMIEQIQEAIKDRLPFLRGDKEFNFPTEDTFALLKIIEPMVNRGLDLLNKIVSLEDLTSFGATILMWECKVVLALLRPLLLVVNRTPFIWLARLIQSMIMVLALLRGVLHQRPKTYNDLDTMDLNDFMVEYGMPEHMRMNPILSAVYIAAFSHTNIERTEGVLSTGAALNMTMSTILYYHGASVYYFRAGTADILCTPLYRYLVNEGVKFNFFHKVTNLHPGFSPIDGTRQIESIDVDVQAELKDGPSSYFPLFRELRQGLQSYPFSPFYDQMTPESAERVRNYNLESYHAQVKPMRSITLRVGVDFDAAVCAIPVSALERISGQLSKSDQIWKRMVTGVKTIPTFGTQFWFTKTSKEIERIVRPGMWGLSHYIPFMDFALDFSQYLDFEDPSSGKACYYSCNSWQTGGEVVYSPEGWPDDQHNTMINMSHDWFQTAFQKVTEQNQFDYNLLVPFDWNRRNNEPVSMKMEQQWFSPNVEPAELYTLSVPNSMRCRLKPDQSGYSNLTLCGDWTDTYWNFGCVEATVSSSNTAAAGTSRYLRSIPKNTNF